MIRHRLSSIPVLAAALVCAGASYAYFALNVPAELQMPGTQPGEVTGMGSATACGGCHEGYDPAVEPSYNWSGSMMAHAARDPVFWAALAIAEQDVPGAGNFCLRCHSPRGWMEGRAVPTDGSALTAADADGVECDLCHRMVNPDGSEHSGVQNPPYVANDRGNPPQAYRGSGMYVLRPGGERLGPYANPPSAHLSLQSVFHRSGDFCGTCHDVSNPAVGDLAHNNGAQVPLQPGTFSGVFGTPVQTKAAFNNFPFQYGIVERTFSEYKASAWPTTRVSDYPNLPVQLRGGVPEIVHEAALLAGRSGDYEDGTVRYYTCQSCHMRPVVGQGASVGAVFTRNDLPLHDLTGGNYWTPEAILWLDARSRLRLGGTLNQDQINALRDGALRARGMLSGAAGLEVDGDRLSVFNRTGHKLISGYPEGRRMWLRIVWRDARGAVLREDGAYGPITATVNGQPRQVDTILDLSGTNTRIYESKPGITRQWANQLLGYGLPASLPLEFDRRTGAVTRTLGQLAAQPPGTAWPTFHFVLNNTVVSDTRIPPLGMRYDEARRRNALPEPADQYGNPGPGGTYRHWDEQVLQPPAGAVTAGIELLNQPTSWEYVQFLALANQGANPFLASTGADILDAWINTGMAAPHVMAKAAWCSLPGTGEDLELRTEVNGRLAATCAKTARAGDQLTFRFRSPAGTFTGAPAAVVLQLWPEGAPPPVPAFPGLWVGQADLVHAVFALPAAGASLPVTVPAGMAGTVARAQAVALSAAAANSTFAASDAQEVHLR